MNAFDVLLAVRGYVKHFFGCEQCRRNFLRGAVHIEDVVHSDRDAILFLWRSHNKANHHLRRDVTEDPDHPKVQFPDRQQCPACHATSGNGSAIWDEDAVFRFLQRMYCGPNAVHDSESAGMGPANYRPKNRAGELSERADRRDSFSASVTAFTSSVINATRLDVSLCLAFYVLCSVILGLLYCRFCRRRCGRKNSSPYSSVWSVVRSVTSVPLSVANLSRR